MAVARHPAASGVAADRGLSSRPARHRDGTSRLISLRYNISFPVVFRYFGFAVATVLIRLALTAPRVIDAALGVVATLFAIALTWV
jgi:hypothetical protein